MSVQPIKIIAMPMECALILLEALLVIAVLVTLETVSPALVQFYNYYCLSFIIVGFNI